MSVILHLMQSLPLMALIIFSTALASPLLTTRSSVAEGSFCKTYGCVLTDRRVDFPETLATLSYTYNVTGGVLDIGRESNMSIFRASLSIPAASWGKPLVDDFLRNFLGLTVDPNSLRRCVRLAAYTGSSVPTPLISGTSGSMSFSVGCAAERSGRIALTVFDQSFQPR